ncbi:MAG: glycosyltransferase family 2 protein [Paracoccaceae bacterium]|nr:glycosyltransferase family 2 protein [Paracoccaceae bacterium]
MQGPVGPASRQAGGQGLSSQTGKADLTACAIVCVRNEIRYLPHLIAHLEEQELGVFFIDNGSDDGTLDYIRSRVGNGVLGVEELPYRGVFSLGDQLQAKAEIEQGLPHDWIMHLDADERPHACLPQDSLLDVVKRADRNGDNVINFEEFVFLPFNLPDEGGGNLARNGGEMAFASEYYYYFAPSPRRLMRLYKRNAGLDNRGRAGHSLDGSVSVYPENQVLRHYIALDQEHLFSKYVGRKFDESELRLTWHKNRTNLTRQDLMLTDDVALNMDRLPHAESYAFSRNTNRQDHFWHW